VHQSPCPPQHGGMGLCTQKKFQEIDAEIVQFCKLKWSYLWFLFSK